MSTLIISDTIPEGTVAGCTVSSWEDRPSAEGQNNLVLDLYFGPPIGAGFCRTEMEDAHFYELGEEVARALRAGGVVVALLGPVMLTDRNLVAVYGNDVMKLKNTWSYDGKLIAQEDTSYDWLDQGFLAKTKIDAKFALPTEGVTTVSRRPGIARYARFASRYWVSIAGIEADKSGGTIQYQVAQSNRWGCYSSQICSVMVLAVGKHTKLPVAAVIRYMDWDGALVLLPPFELRLSGEARSGEEKSLCSTLEDLAEGIREDFLKYEAAEHEDWVWEHRSPRGKQIVVDLGQMKRREEDLGQELQPYDNMLALLDGTGAALVDAVASLFEKPGEGIRVERTEKGASFDLFVCDSEEKTLVIEVTGIKGAFKKDDPHLADCLEYIPEYNEKNEAGRVERIVLVVNTERNTTLTSRNRMNDITRPVEKAVRNNEICVIRSCDLYQMWLRTLEGLTTQEVFDMLFNCEGVFEPSNVGNNKDSQ